MSVYNDIPIFNAGHIIIPAKCVNCKHLHFGVSYTDSFDTTDIHIVRKLCDTEHCDYIPKDKEKEDDRGGVSDGN